MLQTELLMDCNSYSANRVDLAMRIPRLTFGLDGIKRFLMLLFFTLILSGCSEQSLYSGLSEQEANEIVALLQRAKLSATKVAGKENTFSVTTVEDNFASAVQLLQANGLPRTQFDTLGDVFKDQSFVSSSTAQRARYIHALSQEISHTISSIDGVLLSRVHLSVPENDPLSDTPSESSASVFVKHRANVDLSPHIGQIKALVVNGLENLPYDNVTVALFESSPDQRLSTATPINVESAELPIQNMGVVSWLGMALISGALLIFLGFRAMFRRPADTVNANTAAGNKIGLTGAAPDNNKQRVTVGQSMHQSNGTRENIETADKIPAAGKGFGVVEAEPVQRRNR